VGLREWEGGAVVSAATAIPQDPTLQEVFDHVARHLLTQGKRSSYGSGDCVLRMGTALLKLLRWTHDIEPVRIWRSELERIATEWGFDTRVLSEVQP
jgi:hypothetical protein